MPTLRLTWTRQDVNNPWPAEEGLSPNVISSAGSAAVASQAIADYNLTHSVSESADGLVRVAEYTGLAADITDYVATIEPRLNENFDNMPALFNITLDVDVIQD